MCTVFSLRNNRFHVLNMPLGTLNACYILFAREVSTLQMQILKPSGACKNMPEREADAHRHVIGQNCASIYAEKYCTRGTEEAGETRFSVFGHFPPVFLTNIPSTTATQNLRSKFELVRYNRLTTAHFFCNFLDFVPTSCLTHYLIQWRWLSFSCLKSYIA